MSEHITNKNIETITKTVHSYPGFDHYLITNKLQNVAHDFIQSLPNRIKEDLESQNYDSVITKSRTLIESVCNFILQDKANKDDDLSKLVAKCKVAIGIQKESSSDKNSLEALINQFEGGLNSIVQALGKLRNNHSDAHGSITREIIQKRYAVLIANTSISFSEYLLDTYENMSLPPNSQSANNKPATI